MELDFRILDVDERQGSCVLAYKSKKYFLTFKRDNEFIVRNKDGKKRFTAYRAVPRRDYMSYSEYFRSQEFREEFISDMLEEDLLGAEISTVRDYDKEYMRFFDEFFIEKRFRGVCYKNGMYHYLRTDIMGDLVEDVAFDNESSFWEYLEATPYMQNVLNSDLSYHQQYCPKCVDGKYVGESLRPRSKNNFFWKKELFPEKTMMKMSDEIVQSSGPVMKKVTIKRPVIKETDTIWLAVSEGDDNAYKYEFVCIKCEKKINLRTGGGRYGNLGGFRCPFCREKYFASIDDHPQPHTYIYDINDMPASYLEGNHGPHKPLFELELLE